MLFDKQGRLCADRGLMQAAGLHPPSALLDDEACIDLASAWQQTELRLDPAAQQVYLVLPAQFVTTPERERRAWNHGGVAGLLNYDVQHVASSNSTSSLRFSQAGTEAGFNVSDWIVRSRQTVSQLNGTNEIQHSAAFAQRSFVGSQDVLQAGQIRLSNSMFGA